MSNRVRTASWAVLAGVALLPAAAAAIPRIAIEPRSIDLGVIDAGNQFERFVEVKNIGDGVLVITDVKTSCGCTAAAVDGVVELSAGESQKIRVTFDSKNMEGPIHKSVKISSTDPVLPTIDVPLTGDVHAPIRWEPKYVSLNRISAKDPFEQVLQLQTDHSLGVQVKDSYILGGALRNHPSDMFDLEMRPKREGKDRDIHEFVVRLRPDQKPAKVAETMLVLTNLPAPNDTLKVPVRGELVGRILIVPSFAVLPMVEPGQETKRDVTLRASEGTFQVLKAEVANSPIVTEIVPGEKGQKTIVRLLYTGEEAANDGRRTLTIETDDPDQRLIELPVRYQTRERHPQAATTAARNEVVQKKTQGP